MYITTIWEGQSHETLHRGTSTWLMNDNRKVISFRLLNYTSPLITKLHGKLKSKLALLWRKINTKKWVFVVPYHISWQRIAIRCVVTVDYGHFVLPQLKNHFVDSRHLCQGIKHHLTVWISFWGIQNRYKETDKDIACNMHRVAHNNSGSWRSSMKVAIQRDAG